jgi:hypothetical protein
MMEHWCNAIVYGSSGDPWLKGSCTGVGSSVLEELEAAFQMGQGDLEVALRIFKPSE